MSETLNTSEFEKTREDIISLLFLEDDEEFADKSKEYIDRRLNELESKAEVANLDAFNSEHRGFIHPESTISPFFSGDGLRVNDDSIYEIFMTKLRQQMSRIGADSEQDYKKLAFYAAQYTQQDYFGNVHIDSKQAAKREEMVQRGSFVGEGATPPGEPLDLVNFKNVAQCAERAAVANNLLAFAGLEPIYISGKMKYENSDWPEMHAFLVLKGSKGYSIYDPTNPILVGKDSESGRVSDTFPATYKNADEVLEGGTVKAVKKEYIVNDSGELEVASETNVTFTGDTLKAAKVERAK